MYKFICSAKYVKYVKYAKSLAAKYTTHHVAAAAIIFGNSFHKNGKIMSLLVTSCHTLDRGKTVWITSNPNVR